MYRFSDLYDMGGEVPDKEYEEINSFLDVHEVVNMQYTQVHRIPEGCYAYTF